MPPRLSCSNTFWYKGDIQWLTYVWAILESKGTEEIGLVTHTIGVWCWPPPSPPCIITGYLPQCDKTWISQHRMGHGHYSHVIMNAVASQTLASRLFAQPMFGRRSRKASKLRITGLCKGNPPVTGGFPQKGSVTRKMFPFDDVIMVEAEFFVNTCLPENIHCKVALSPSRTVMGLSVEYIRSGALFLVVVSPENTGHCWRLVIGLLANQNCCLTWHHKHGN